MYPHCTSLTSASPTDALPFTPLDPLTRVERKSGPPNCSATTSPEDAPFCPLKDGVHAQRVSGRYQAVIDMGLYGAPRDVAICHLQLLNAQGWLDEKSDNIEIRFAIFNDNHNIALQVGLKYDMFLGGRAQIIERYNAVVLRDMYV